MSEVKAEIKACLDNEGELTLFQGELWGFLLLAAVNGQFIPPVALEKVNLFLQIEQDGKIIKYKIEKPVQLEDEE